MSELNVFLQPAQLNAGLAQDLVARLEQLLATGHERLNVAISGGNTPLGLLDRLLVNHSDSKIWKRVHLYWVDERYVPFDHPESNYGNARPFVEALGIPLDQIHPMELGAKPELAAASYGKCIEVIASVRDENEALFDLTLLGLGPDGHVASLFPGTDHSHDQTFCKATIRPETGQARITLTYPALNRSRWCIFMASGAAKAEIVSTIFRGSNPQYPASLISPPDPPLWYLDEAAASRLSQKTRALRHH